MSQQAQCLSTILNKNYSSACFFLIMHFTKTQFMVILRFCQISSLPDTAKIASGKKDLDILQKWRCPLHLFHPWKVSGNNGFFWDLSFRAQIDSLNFLDLWVNSAPDWVISEYCMGCLHWDSTGLGEHKVGEYAHNHKPSSKEQEDTILHGAKHGGEALANHKREELHRKACCRCHNSKRRICSK